MTRVIRTKSMRRRHSDMIDITLLDQLGPLAKGAHKPDGKACIMEAVAFVAGEPWSDHPACACPVISTFLRSWNDALPDDERDVLLRPLVPLLVNTKVKAAIENRRSLMAADWFVRVHTVAWLRLAKLDASADALAALPEITAMAQVPSLRGPIEAARRDADAAWAAVGAAAWDAAGAAAGPAAGAAAWDAAWAAARDAAGPAAGAAAWDAAGPAAGAAAWDAAGAAAWAALDATRKELQQSALQLVHRMIKCRA
ncbi:MAG: hypothetical protein ACREDY_20440 [Bradyrhizobium sp.]